MELNLSWTQINCPDSAAKHCGYIAPENCSFLPVDSDLWAVATESGKTQVSALKIQRELEIMFHLKLEITFPLKLEITLFS
jgi:hypothetical protein